jgi:hypothetical protein
MQIDLTAAAIATLISSGVAATTAILINNGNVKKSLNDQLDNILKIAIQYPYLESSKFTSTWKANKDSNEDNYLRYENYCILVFNYMERLSKFYNYNEQKIANHINLKEWVRHHREYWMEPATPFENVDGYNKKFRELMASYLK